MRAIDVIRKKRDGEEVTREELSFLISHYCSGQIPDYQLSAFLMAVFLRGMTDEEMVALTEEMRLSGATFDLSDLPGRKVDKHSTGGVGDKTSLVIAPAVAAAGVVVPMISGRGLGHTGGTLDKLESIPGFNVRLTQARFREVLASIGVALAGQTDDIVPADRKLYALRDVTATVESCPLIAASIMSKKLAEGIDGLVLDVKTGSGAFMKRQEDAEALAHAMVAIGRSCGKRMVALITDMGQPLGTYMGNALEVIESIETLKGKGPEDLTSLCQELSAHCLVLGEAAETMEDGRRVFRESIESGRALERFREVIRAQEGDPAVIDDYSRLPAARFHQELPSPASGVLRSMDTEQIGLALCVLGAGRETMESIIDPAVGMHLHKKIGDRVEVGEPLCTLHYNDWDRYRDARDRIMESFRFSSEPRARPALIRKVITG
jgi:pyrimidine-nucleoside phosphorylase